MTDRLNPLDACVVPFDEWSGCAVDVQRRHEPERTFVELSFILKSGDSDSQYLTLCQAVSLKLALEAVIRADPPSPDPHAAVVPRLRLVRDSESIAADRW
jgi:hypothetical protein